MKTWSLMYGLIWAAFLQILIVLFPVFGEPQTYLHMGVGVLILVMAYMVVKQVQAIPCPKRIKTITKTTFGLAALQGVLGVGLFGANQAGYGWVAGAIGFLHVANGLAIITQASSSTTAYDMWEEKEFLPTPSAADEVQP